MVGSERQLVSGIPHRLPVIHYTTPLMRHPSGVVCKCRQLGNTIDQDPNDLDSPGMITWHCSALTIPYHIILDVPLGFLLVRIGDILTQEDSE